ncbi:MAG: Uncharacterized protein Greene041619_153 [Candidatus Peregrinibacteria bacterium Greene0416_19]|nr:MAG: Uncharacterized protein Greene041619_153 [Candidatus Peregrinibacteria bacterium Greene0416_19]
MDAMKTLLLLAGRSRRFWPLEEKSLFPLCGQTLLAHQIDRLKKGGCKEKDIILVGGKHNKKETRALFPRLTFVEQKDLDLGMRGALLSALPRLRGESVMVVGGNDVVEPEAYALLRKAAEKKDGAILAQRVKRYFPGGYLTVKSAPGHAYRVTSIIEKPGEGNEPSKLVNIVAHVHNDPAALLAALKKVRSNHDDGYEAALASMFDTHEYAAVAYEGIWQPVKYPWHLLPLLQLLLKDVTTQSIHRTATVHQTAVIDGAVILEEGVKVMPHATIVGPCVIGAGSIVGNNALVCQASVGKKCVIGYDTEVKSSVLADNVWTHSTYLGDSVIGESVSFGGGTMTGNFRLDEGEIMSKVDGAPVPTGLAKLGAIVGQGCRFGIQVGVNPGVKVGRDTFIVGGSFVTEDVPDGSFVRMKEGKCVVSGNRTTAPDMAQRKKYFS